MLNIFRTVGFQMFQMLCFPMEWKLNEIIQSVKTIRTDHLFFTFWPQVLANTYSDLSDVVVLTDR